MEDELVSVIVPVYNCEKFIKNTIETVENQTYTNWELILIDDCSTDSSIEIINEKIKASHKDKIKLIKLKENSGAAVARNNGIEIAKGTFIAFLDSDDFWDENKLEKQILFMKKEKCAFSFTGYQFADEDGNKNGKKVYIPNKLIYKQALKNTTISTITVMFDMRKIDKETIKMPNIRKGQDTATWWKILKNDFTAYGLNEILSFYRRGGQTLSSNKLYALKRTWNLYRKQEKLSIIKTLYYYIYYLVNTIKRRI